jgi:hypothetical protein
MLTREKREAWRRIADGYVYNGDPRGHLAGCVCELLDALDEAERQLETRKFVTDCGPAIRFVNDNFQGDFYAGEDCATVLIRLLSELKTRRATNETERRLRVAEAALEEHAAGIAEYPQCIVARLSEGTLECGEPRCASCRLGKRIEGLERGAAKRQ